MTKVDSKVGRGAAPLQIVGGAKAISPEVQAELVNIALEIAALDARRGAKKASFEVAAALSRATDATLAAETKAFSAAGLEVFNGSDAENNVPGAHSRQAVVLVNTRAHPAALVGMALARAERAQAFARVLEKSSVDDDSGEATYALARMVEEVVEALKWIGAHSAIAKAPTPTPCTP